MFLFHVRSANGTFNDSSSFSGSGFGNSSAARTIHNDDNGDPSPSIMTFCGRKKQQVSQKSEYSVRFSVRKKNGLGNEQGNKLLKISFSIYSKLV